MKTKTSPFHTFSQVLMQANSVRTAAARTHDQSRNIVSRSTNQSKLAPNTQASEINATYLFQAQVGAL